MDGMNRRVLGFQGRGLNWSLRAEARAAQKVSDREGSGGQRRD